MATSRYISTLKYGPNLIQTKCVFLINHQAETLCITYNLHIGASLRTKSYCLHVTDLRSSGARVHCCVIYRVNVILQAATSQYACENLQTSDTWCWLGGDAARTKTFQYVCLIRRSTIIFLYSIAIHVDIHLSSTVLHRRYNN